MSPENQPPENGDEEAKYGQNRLFEPTPLPTEEEAAIKERESEMIRLGISPNKEDGSPKTPGQIWVEIGRSRRAETEPQGDTKPHLRLVKDEETPEHDK